MKIESIHVEHSDKFYENKYLKELVDIALENYNNDFFDDILGFIMMGNENLSTLFKKKHNANEDLVNSILSLITNIFNDNQCDSLRGAFLELLIFNFLDKKYSIKDNYSDIDINCFVKIDDKKSEKTVDVFAHCINKGFICEAKLKHINFTGEYLSELKRIFLLSDNILSPYIITLADRRTICNKLKNIVQEDYSNSWVNLDDINIVSIDELNSFFS